MAQSDEDARRYNVLKRLVETKRHVYITTRTSEVGEEVIVASSGILVSGVNLDNALELVERDLESSETAELPKVLADEPPELAPPCPTCEGCGQVANTEGREPWTAWMRIEFRSSAAIGLGLVKPIPCPDCGGSGRTKKEKDDAKPDPVPFDGGPHGLAGSDAA